jgi:transcriptional regulator with XRE-family HTH domain
VVEINNMGEYNYSDLDEIVLKATGQRIKYLVKKAGFSQSELARILDRDSKTISNYYCGKSLPILKDLIKLSRILGKSYDDLLVFKGDIEGFQRINLYILDYHGHDRESTSEAIDRSRKESKLFNPDTKGRANIRTLEEAGFCLEFFNDYIQKDLRNRIMDVLLSGGGVNSIYMHHIFERYIWRKLTKKQQTESREQFAIWRGEKVE